MLKKRCALISLFLLISFSNFGQELTAKWSFVFQLDNRLSSIRNQEITVFGAKVGFQYKKLTRIGLGSSFIINPVYINYFNKKINMEETNKISFWYFSFFNDWILYKNKLFVTVDGNDTLPEANTSAAVLFPTNVQFCIFTCVVAI